MIKLCIKEEKASPSEELKDAITGDMFLFKDDDGEYFVILTTIDNSFVVLCSSNGGYTQGYVYKDYKSIMYHIDEYNSTYKKIKKAKLKI